MTDVKRRIKSNKILMACIIVCIGLCLMMLTACGEKGLGAAYDKLTKGQKDGSLTKYTYDEKTDTLTITLDRDETKPDELFDVLDKYVEDEDIGSLIIMKSTGSPESEQELLTLGERLGQLPCKSIKMVSPGPDIGDMDGKWTAILPKAEELYIDAYIYAVSEGYTAEEQGRLADMKKVRYYTNTTNGINFSVFEKFANVEELIISAGLTPQEQQAAIDRGGFNYREDESDLTPLKNREKLTKLLLFPEAKGWTPGQNYYNMMFTLKRMLPDLETNIPGPEGDEEAGKIVALKDYDILRIASDIEKDQVLDGVLMVDAGEAYEKGQQFKKRNKTPKLKGKVLIYAATPFDHQFGKDEFYDMSPRIVRDELGKTKIKFPEDINDYSTFIYIYPKYTFYGNYDKGTKGYSTKTMVRIYDMEKGIRYVAKEVSSENPPQSFSYYGTSAPDKHYPELNLKKAYKYIKSLKTAKSESELEAENEEQAA